MPSIPVWTEPRLRLAPLPLDIPRAGQLLTPAAGFVLALSGDIHPGSSTEQRVRSQPASPSPRQPGAELTGHHFHTPSAMTNGLLRLLNLLKTQLNLTYGEIHRSE